jgi:hypothetical protein
MDGALAGYLLAVARVASLNPPVMFYVMFTDTIVVDRYNTLEVKLAYWYVYMQPAGGLAPFVRSLLGAEAA